MKNIYIQLLDLLKKRERIALATIVEAEGSTPQIPGASAIFSTRGLIRGTLGGGLLEFDAQEKAVRGLGQNKSLCYSFFLNADISLETKPICGGKVKILIDSRPEDNLAVLEELGSAVAQRRTGLLATAIGILNDGEALVRRIWIEKNEDLSMNPECPLYFFREEIKKVFAEEKPLFLALKKKLFFPQAKESFLFFEPLKRPSQLVIAGAGHIGKAVANLGSLLKFEVTVIDDRPEFANFQNIPDADHIIVEEIGKAIQNIRLNSDTFIVIVTRGHQQDAESLRSCIKSDAAYIGVIGSKRKIQLMRQRFIDEGWATAEEFDRVHAPIGLEIHSQTVEEIAVSIAAELILVRNALKNPGQGK